MKQTVFSKFVHWYFSKSALPYWCVLLIDCAIVLVTGYVARYITVGGNVFAGTFWQYTMGLLVLLCVYIIFFRLRRTYTGIIRYSSFRDLARVGGAVGMAATVFYCIERLIAHSGISLTMILPDWPEQAGIALSAILLMMAERILVKTLYEQVRLQSDSFRTFIYGIRDGGVSLAKGIRSQSPIIYNLKGFVAPDEGNGFSHVPETLMGVRVYNDDADLLETITARSISVLLVSPLQVEHFREQDALVKGLIARNVKIMMLPSEVEWDGKSDLHAQSLRNVDIEDLLPRDKIEVDLQAIGRLIEGKTVLVTGAAGSIGYEMARQIAKFLPDHLIMVDQAETPMHTARLHMAKHYPKLHCETIVSSITNQTKMEAIFRTYKPDYVFHAAAYKHVPMMEDNPAEAVQNNVYGTRVIADLAVKYGTKKFVMISTDKAVNPTNVMGCSKRICEIYCQALNAEIQRLRAAAEDRAESASFRTNDHKLSDEAFPQAGVGHSLGSMKESGRAAEPSQANLLPGAEIQRLRAAAEDRAESASFRTNDHKLSDEAFPQAGVGHSLGSMKESGRAAEPSQANLLPGAEIQRLRAAAENNTQSTATQSNANDRERATPEQRTSARAHTALAEEEIRVNLADPCSDNNIRVDSSDSWSTQLLQADGSLPVTQFVTTRFGNVLGSNGSVIPIFKKQIEQGGPLTVTHPDIIRFFMLIPEACRLVLQAGTMGKGGEIYVFDMGKPVRIADLAQRMIDLSGAHDRVQIVYTGLRDGEKLYEEVLSDAEQTKPTTHPKIMVAAVREYPYDLALRNEIELHELSYTYDDMAIVKKMKEIVPEFKSRHSKYEVLD